MLYRVLIMALVAFAASEEKTCMDHCKANACANLNGNVYNECGTCVATYSCNPVAADFKKMDVASVDDAASA